MEKILTIDEAIEILKKEKERGNDTVIYLIYDNDEKDISKPGIKIPINQGIKVIMKTKNPIAYMESRIMKTLTSVSPEKMEIITF